MARLTKKQQAQKLLEQAKAREAAKGAKPKFVDPGVTGDKLTGRKRWG